MDYISIQFAENFMLADTSAYGLVIKKYRSQG